MREPFHSSEPAQSAGNRAFVGRLALLWAVGNCLRVTVLAVPPVLPAIHHDLRLSEAAVGALTALPIVLLAAGAVPGSLLVARAGARRALIVGLLLVALAGAVRGAQPVAALLFATTFLMGVGIAVSQPALPSLVRQWFPGHTALATAVYSNGFLVGEILAASLTVPLLPLVGGRWQLALLLWSVPVLMAALAIAVLTSPSRRSPGDEPSRWWPDWRSGRTWRLGLILGGASAAYFGTNAFVPDYLKATQHAVLIAPALTSVNLSQLPASFLVAAWPRLFVGRRWPIAAAGSAIVAAALGYALGGVWVVVCAAALGFAAGAVFVLSLALPPILAGAGDVHRLSAAMFTIAYVCPFVGSLLGGAAWDLSHIPTTAFLPMVAAGLLMVWLCYGLPALPAD